MVNARGSFGLVALLAASGVIASDAAAQRLPFEDVLENDAVQVLSSQWQQGTARRAIPPRVTQDVEWPAELAEQLLQVVEGIGAEGLDPADYKPEDLRNAIMLGEGVELDNVAGAIFIWLVEDLRDGRTPADARRSYLVDDPHVALMPTAMLAERALASGDIAGVVASLNPTHPDYAALRSALAATPITDVERREAIRANMDRWRWLPRELGGVHLLANVPEYRLQLSVNGRTLRNYRTIVGKPGRTATPQMSEMVEGVIFNPTWTVPQSIVVGEGLGSRVLNNPNWARARGYTATRGANGYVSVVQAPGPQNSLGGMKLDMPNAQAIFLHDTNAPQLFANDNRALSHGCIRVQDALELAVTLGLLNQSLTRDEARTHLTSGEYTRVPLTTEIPVYITYFTMGVNQDGELVEFGDIYGRDDPVLAALSQPSQRQVLTVAGL